MQLEALGAASKGLIVEGEIQKFTLAMHDRRYLQDTHPLGTAAAPHLRPDCRLHEWLLVTEDISDKQSSLFTTTPLVLGQVAAMTGALL